MFSLNRIQLTGYLTQPVDLRRTPGGTSVADLNIGCPYTFKADAGQTINGTAYYTVTAWAGLADIAGQYLKPGAQVFLSGRLQTDSWEDEKSGEKRSKTKVIAMDIIMLDPKDGQIETDAAAKPITACFNRADVIGHLTRDPELRTTTNGKNVVSMGVATNERWKDKTSGEMKERVEFHNVVVWEGIADLCSKHLKKGQRVHVAGRVQTRTWETKQGSKRYTTEIVADSVSLLGVKNTDMNYSSELLSASSPSKAEAETVASVSVEAGIPAVQYESGVKVEDLPF